MLRLMRDKAGNWVIKILLGAIVIVFIFWGVGSFRERGGGKVASVNGETITMAEYRKSYNELMEQLRKSFGNNLNEDTLKMLQVKKQALDRIIDKKLLLGEASQLNFRVSEKELANAIRSIGAFQNAGVFDSRLYQRVLNLNRLTAEEFETVQRESMLMEKLRSFITGSVKVSDQEIMEWFNWANTSLDIDFVLFAPEKYKDIPCTPEETSVYFNDHKSAYKTDPMVKVRYLFFEHEAYTGRVKIADDEIKAFYDENREEFNTPKTVEARHILRTVSQDAGPEDVEKARATTLEIMQMAKSGEDFSELAKRFSQGPTKNKGGYLGTFKREDMVAPFSDKAFSMEAGEISEPVRTPFGWHIIKVEKVNEGGSRSFEESEAEIRKKLTDIRARNMAYDEAETVYDASFKEDDLVKSAEKRKLKTMTTDFFTREGPVKEIQNSKKFSEAAFTLLPMEISDVQDLGDGYYILQAIDKIPEKIPDLEKVKERVTADLVKEKQSEQAKKDANELLVVLTGIPMEPAAQKFNLKAAASGFFKRDDSPPKIDFGREVVAAAFQLSNSKKLPDDVIKGEKGYYVIQLRERKKPDLKEFDKDKRKIEGMLLQQKKASVFTARLSELRNKNEISIEKDFLD